MDTLELVFAHKDGLDIYMDVYVPQDANPSSPVPVILWWHGGGLLQGTRKGVAAHQLACPAKRRICFISADYRLAPQTRMPGILEDCKSAIEFIRSPTFAEATGHRIDPAKLCLSGSSAGGWLALLAGTGIGYASCGLDPPPPVSGLTCIYPITSLQDPFWKTKQHPVSYRDAVIKPDEVVPFINPSDIKVASSALDSKRSIFYHYMIQEAILGSLLLDGTGIPESAFSVAAQLRSGAFTAPPSYITHGSIDDKVPARQSVEVVEAMQERNIPVQFDYFEGLDHLFDRDPRWEMENMYNFIERLFV